MPGEQPDTLPTVKGYEEAPDILYMADKQLATPCVVKGKSAASLLARMPTGTVNILPTAKAQETPLDALPAGGDGQCHTHISAGTELSPMSPHKGIQVKWGWEQVNGVNLQG